MQKLELGSKKKSRPKKLRLGFYPYTYVRTTVMKSLLFKKEDYHKMLKMGFSEIAKFLQESNYKKEINELSVEHSDADLLELVLNKNLSYSFKKLIRISSYELALLINEYAKRKDIEDIKTILRGKFTNTDEKLIRNSITAAGTLSLDFMTSLLKKESIEEVLKNNSIVEFSLLKDGLKALNEKKTLVNIENALDKYYYNHLIEFSRILPKQGDLFRNFLLKEVEILNILTLLRLKKVKFDKKAIPNFIIPTGNKLKDTKIKSLADVGDLDELSRALEKTEYKNVVQKGIKEFEESNSLITLETELYQYLLKESILLLHQHPLSIDVILGFMFAKDIEIRNLRIIIKGKQLGLSEEFIENQLVF
jgi:V/A-type H+-transporting ATPase subunit C|tara:strand:+ start:2562 stop:3653 length:1092 start_codon:yes stop_codon:yes gene_type:complete